MRAKDLADLAGTTVRTIRYYHQIGLLAVPERGATWRSYGFAHLTRLMRIRWLVDSGVPLAEVPHLLRPPTSADERTVVAEDLDAVLASIDARIELLVAQRARVATLLERVATEDRLSPLPPAMVRLYAALLERHLPDPLVEVMLRERDLLELACYRGALPPDLVTLVAALSERDLDELCALLWEAHRVNESAGERLTPQQRDRITAVVRGTVDLAGRVEPGSTRRLLRRAAVLDRPGVRAALNLAYPSPVYHQLVADLVAVAKEA